MNPEVRSRFVDYIEYLRRTGFFEDNPNLNSEKILENIFSGKIDYTTGWNEEDEWGRVKRRPDSTSWSQVLKGNIEGHEE